MKYSRPRSRVQEMCFGITLKSYSPHVPFGFHIFLSISKFVNWSLDHGHTMVQRYAIFSKNHSLLCKFLKRLFCRKLQLQLLVPLYQIPALTVITTFALFSSNKDGTHIPQIPNNPKKCGLWIWKTPVVVTLQLLLSSSLLQGSKLLVQE